jgi:hydrogenase-4 component B
MDANALTLALAAAGTSLLGAAVPIVTRSTHGRRAGMNLLLALTGILTVAAGLRGLLAGGASLILPLGLPWLPMHVRVDALGSFFLLLVGALLLPVAIYAQGYLRAERNVAPLAVFMPLFVLGMLGVIIADDAFTFMLCWELMSVASYFLVSFEHAHAEHRRAGFIYLLMAHLAGLLILGGFAVLYTPAGSFEFSAMRDAALSPFWASVAFLLAAAGFGMKAGTVPLHGWLAEAHPAAPSHASALLSGVMLKVAVFGFLRLVWDLVGIQDFQWWWGALVLAAGSGSALIGVLLALQQQDLKRLLAYSSVENIGIILIGVGLGMLLVHFGHPLLASLGLVAALYHALNHAMFKGLLFMGAGAVAHATGTRDMEALGGLIRRMPVTAALFLVACVSISALPPFNGFVSEWLTFQTALMAPQLGGALLTAIVPFAAAMLALASALAATCFVKVFGIVFLGRPRSEAAERAHEVNGWMRWGMIVPAVACLLLGLLPVLAVPLMDAVPQSLLHVSLAASVHAHGWLWFTPVEATRASYAPPVVLAGMLALGGIAYWWLHPKGSRVRRDVPWSCGHAQTSPRMQYTGTAFVQPLRQIFSGLYRPEVHAHLERPQPLLTRQVRYVVHVRDRIVQHLYLPLGHAVTAAAGWLGRQHQRGIHAYLTYIFITVLVLLAFVA